MATNKDLHKRRMAALPRGLATAMPVFVSKASIESEGLVDCALKIGLEVRARRDDLRPIGNIRGKGSMLALDLLESRNSSKGDPAATQAVLQRAHSLGLILLSPRRGTPAGHVRYGACIQHGSW